jgi:cytochrome c oxidase cbb3-type subunit 1
MGLATAFYIIPKTIGQAIHSYHLSLLGFWTLLLFGAWAGTSNLIAGPLPAWMVSVGVVASVMMLIPALSVALNLHLTLSSHYAPVGWSPALRFVVVGISCLFAYWVAVSLVSIPAVNAVTNFSDINRGIYKVGYYGFFAFTAFGAIYYITPRLTGNEWPCGGGINWHFWLAASGLAFVAISLLLGGLIQAYALQEPIVTFRSSLELAWPFRFLAAIGSIILCAAAAVFAMNFAGTLIDTRQRTKPALLAEREEPSQEPVAV